MSLWHEDGITYDRRVRDVTCRACGTTIKRKEVKSIGFKSHAADWSQIFICKDCATSMSELIKEES